MEEAPAAFPGVPTPAAFLEEALSTMIGEDFAQIEFRNDTAYHYSKTRAERNADKARVETLVRGFVRAHYVEQ